MQRGGLKRRAVTKRGSSSAASPSSTASGLKLDAQGRIQADIDPTKKFAPQTDITFVDEFQRNIEDAAQQVRSREADQSALPARLIDSMKSTPVHTMRGTRDALTHLWTETDGGDVDAAFFQDCLAALEADAAAHRRLYTKLSLKDSADAADLPFWHHHDKDLDLYTDSEEEKDTRINRFPPPLRCLRKIERVAAKRRQQRVIVLRALSLLKKKKSLADLKPMLREEQLSQHTTAATASRREQREWQKAADVARFSLSLPAIAASSPVKMNSPKKSIVSLYLFLLSRRFPEALRSRQFAAHAETLLAAGVVPSLSAFDQGCQWSIPDTHILGNVGKYRDLPQLLVTPAASDSPRFYLANLSTALGFPYSETYRSTHILKEFPMLLASFDTFTVLDCIPELGLRPRNRDLRAAATLKLTESAVGKKSVQVNQGSTAEFNDSEDDAAETKQYAAEAKLIKQYLSKSTDMPSRVFNAFGPEHVSMRFGGDHGRLRNQFDVNRTKLTALDALAGDEDDLPPVIYESSEDENTPFVDYQRKYRKRYRLYKDPLKVNSKIEETSSAVSQWPGSVLDKYKRRLQEAAQQKESPTKKKKRAVSFWRGQTHTLNADGEQIPVEESWKTMAVKPRVRMIETRFDRGGTIPLGFVGTARDINGSETQLLGIDEAELHRRFALNKLWQLQMVGRDQYLADRRYFALVLNEEEGTARVIPAHPTKLIYTASPTQALEDLNWELYWRQAKEGKIQSRTLVKEMRYNQLKMNNFVIWKDGLEKYQKLRERVNELQTHETPRTMKLKLLAKNPKIALNEMAVPSEVKDFYTSSTNHEVNWAGRNAKELAFKRKIALRTRVLIEANAKSSRKFRPTYKEFRRHIAERALYEQSWISNKAKRSTEATLAAAALD